MAKNSQLNKSPNSAYSSLPPYVAPVQIAKKLGLGGEEELAHMVSDLHITEFEFQDKSAKAKVEQWHVQLRYRSESVEGECDCPESDGFEFCSHCAALTLHTNKYVQQIGLLDKGPDKSKIMAYLLTQDRQTLAKTLMDFISDDAEQFDRYLVRAVLSKNKIDYAQLKGRITDLTKIQERLFSQRQVKHFFKRIERLLEEFALVECYTEPEKMLKVIEYAFQRITKVLDQIDDNSMQRADCVALLQKVYSRLFKQMTGRDDTKIKRLFSCWAEDRYGLFPEDMTLFFDDSLYEKFVEKLEQNLNEILASQQGDAAALATEKKQLKSKLLRFMIGHQESQGDQLKVAYFRELLSQA